MYILSLVREPLCGWRVSLVVCNGIYMLYLQEFLNIVISYVEALHVKFSFTFIYCGAATNCNQTCHYNLSVASNNSKWSERNKSQYYIPYRRQRRALDTIQTSNSLTAEHNRLHLLCTPKGWRGSAVTDCKLKLDTSIGVCAHSKQASKQRQAAGTTTTIIYSRILHHAVNMSDYLV
jgi:hypothetical protein